MLAQNRIVINTIALYLKNILHLLISLWSVPIILKLLGANDFGLFNLVAGVIAMLSFLNSAMTVSTQRYISVYLGKGEESLINQVFNSSIILHFLIGIVVVIIFELCGTFVFDGFFNIEQSRINAAKIIYQFLVLSTFFTIISVPYVAIINAYENLVFLSVIGVLDPFLKLLLAYSLYLIDSDKLIFYGFGVALISLIDVLIYRIYVKLKYKSIKQRFKMYFNKKLTLEMMVFSSWNTFGALAILGRNQGIAVILNKFFGTIINASYGVANQINGVLTTFSHVLQQSINPQLMKNEGSGNRIQMLKISYISSKFCVMIVAIMAVPLIIEMPFILKLWLGNIPDYTIEFSRLVLILSLFSQLSTGVMSAIQSGGKIAKYQVTMSVLILMNIPISIVLLYYGFPPYFVVVGFIFIEIISLLVRLIFAKKLIGYDAPYFILNVIGLTIIPTLLSFSTGGLVCYLVPQMSFLRCVVTFVVCVITFLLTAWLFSVNSSEKQYIRSIISNIKNRFSH